MIGGPWRFGAYFLNEAFPQYDNSWRGMVILRAWAG